jgi:hypothetical protein
VTRRYDSLPTLSFLYHDHSTAHADQIEQGLRQPPSLQVLFQIPRSFGSLVSLQTQASSNVVEDVDIVIDTSESALARSLSEDRDISKVPTFSDVTPAVQFHLSKGSDVGNDEFLNKGQPVLKSTVGTKGVRDVFLGYDSTIVGQC